ncbi:uncharacterized protein LOC128132829 [Lactuca sativa]|uniref:uncharacterized protein LOC128132829 n=1 Tax=Lactuca sativa TaxID=4236 RepID=UPI0022B029B3|nr:uncharacterized protein LOC128132829 [Lactuca sativa]
MIEYLVWLVTGGRWQVNGTNLEYVCPQRGISEFALIFSEYISYSDFVSLVRSKIGLLDKYRISLCFHHPELNYYIAIVEDMDVRMLINVIKCSGGRAVKVFVVVDEVEEVNGGGEIGNQLVGNLCSYKGSNDPIDITELQSNSDRDELGDEVKAKFPDNLFHGMPLEEVTWFNRACNYAKSNNVRYLDEEEFLEVVTDFYICEHDGRDFEYEEVWKVVKNKQYFM